MNSVQLTAAERVVRERVGLLLDQPFFGTLLLRLKMVEDTEGSVCKTMATDGSHIFFYQPFVDKCTNAEVKGVLAHEVLHVANLHHFRRGARKPEKFNIACDAAINPILKDAGFSLPAGGVDLPWAKNLAAEQIYDQLPDEPPGGGEIPGGVLDSPIKGQAERQAEENEIKIAVKQAALAQAMKTKGDTPAWLKRMIDDICEVKVPWQDLLRRFVSNQIPSGSTWARPNRRHVANGIYLPGQIKTGIGEGLVYWDSSGSCSDVQGQFFAELNFILEDLMPERMTVVQCDADVGDFHTYEQGEPLKPDVVGGGGSDFRPAFKAVEEAGIQPQWAVVLSDMEIDFPKDPPPYPVLLISTTAKPGPSWGEHVKM